MSKMILTLSIQKGSCADELIFVKCTSSSPYYGVQTWFAILSGLIVLSRRLSFEVL